MPLSRIKLRYAELINEVKVNKKADLINLNNSYNHLIVKLLYPIQFDKKPKKLTNKLKIDSLIARLNKEFVGFNCLYFIKFTKLSFYQ